MYNCLSNIIRYYSPSSCKNLPQLETNANNLVIWYLENGTVVRAKTKDDIKNTIFNQLKSLHNYWATQITNDIWEIQFDKSNDPLVKSIVKAENYIDAVTKAKLYLNIDYKDVNVIDYNIV
mgnify:CR=1 FL=1